MTNLAAMSIAKQLIFFRLLYGFVSWSTPDFHLTQLQAVSFHC
jgi:hypothetical protein